jgi:hypothetical protein
VYIHKNENKIERDKFKYNILKELKQVNKGKEKEGK